MIVGRTRVPSWFNPWYWILLNDEDRTAPEAVNGVPYWAGWPQWWRNFMWWWRNPAANFMEYVIGFRDRNYLYEGDAPVEDGTLADSGKTGWKNATLTLDDGRRFPYWSYSGRWVFYLGWRYNGGFGIKLHPHS